MSGTSDNGKNIPHGQHLLADLFGVEDEKLNDPTYFAGLLKEVAAVARLSLAADPHVIATANGCHGFLLLNHAHISVYAVPAAQYLALDIFIYGSEDPETMFNAVKEAFASQMVRKTTITRGLQS